MPPEEAEPSGSIVSSSRREGRAPAALVVVTGPPGAGKTTLARGIAAELGLPLLTKDDVKECLADSLDVAGAAWSRRLGMASFVLLARLVPMLLDAGVSVVCEGNFPSGLESDLARALRDRAAQGEVSVVQVLCRADGEVLLERYRRRDSGQSRHPIHLDRAHLADPAFRERLAGEPEPLAVEGTVIAIDTTEFGSVDVHALCRRVKRALAG